MKLVIAALTLVASAQSFALSASDSWSTILNTPDIKTVAATVACKAGDATTMVSVLDLCVMDNGQFMTVEKQNIWAVAHNGHTTTETVVGQERLVGSNTYVSQVKIGNGVYAPVVQTISTVQSVDVMYKSAGSSASAVKLFSKSFTIPACK